MTLAGKYWAKVVIGDGCWGWRAATSGGGYGKLMFGSRPNRKYLDAHRVSWELHNGPIPHGMRVLHRCDNPICSNPEHLFLGSQGDNVADMMAKGRNVTTALALDVAAIASAYQSGTTMAAIAKSLDCNLETVRQRLLGNGVVIRPRGRATRAEKEPPKENPILACDGDACLAQARQGATP